MERDLSLELKYDAVGNRLSSTLNGVTTAYTYDPATNRLVSTSGGQVESFAYDLDGRLTSDGLSSSYAYTPNNLLEAAMTQAGALNLYRYDADGQRVLKIGGAGAGTTDVVNGLSELSTNGGPITWTVDYVYAGTKLLAAVRPAVGRLDTLTVVKSGSGGVSARPAGLDCGPDCSARYLAGTAVTLTAVPAAGFVFGGWSGACSGTSASATVTMSGNVSCTATFGHRLTVSARLKSGSPYNDVEWTSSPAGIDCWTGCAANFPSGTVVTLYTSEMPSSWSGDCSLHQSLTMDGDKLCIAIFNNYLGPIRLGTQAAVTGSATDETAGAAPPLETAASAGGSGAAATSSAVGLGYQLAEPSVRTRDTAVGRQP